MASPFFSTVVSSACDTTEAWFTKIQSIDLFLLDSDDPAVVSGLVQQVERVIREDGLLFLENYGISLDQVQIESLHQNRDVHHC